MKGRLSRAVLLCGVVGSALMLAATCVCAAPSFEGPTGCALDPFAMVPKAGEVDLGSHFLDLGSPGVVFTYHVNWGIGGQGELGATRIGSGVSGTRDSTIVHGKYILTSKDSSGPAVAVGFLVRDMDGDDATSDYYLVITQVFKKMERPIILSAGVRTTDAVGMGLFGGTTGHVLLNGDIAWMVKPDWILAFNIRGMAHSSAWWTACTRYYPSDRVWIDAGLFDLGTGLEHKFGMAVGMSF